MAIREWINPHTSPRLVRALAIMSIVFLASQNIRQWNDEFAGTIATIQKSDEAAAIPFCNRAQLQSGQWIEAATTQDHPTWDTDRPMWHAHQYVPELNEYHWAEGSSCSPHESDYEWQPHDTQRGTRGAAASCHFTEWDPNLFCDLMRGSTILMIGDSLTYEHFQTLVHALGGNSNVCPTIVQPVCHHKETYVLFKEQRYPEGKYLKHEGIDALLHQYAPSMVILNQGTHYTTDDELLPELTKTFETIGRWQRKCRDIYGVKCHFVWRTTVPGHPDCGLFDAPVNDLSFMEKSIQRGDSKKQGWENFEHQNYLVLEQLASMAPDNRLSTMVLDAYHLNLLRPDQHRNPPFDCVHNCLPGKISVYNQLLLHWLIQERTLDDQRVLEESSYRPKTPMSVLRPKGCDQRIAMAAYNTTMTYKRLRTSSEIEVGT